MPPQRKPVLAVSDYDGIHRGTVPPLDYAPRSAATLADDIYDIVMRARTWVYSPLPSWNAVLKLPTLGMRSLRAVLWKAVAETDDVEAAR